MLRYGFLFALLVACGDTPGQIFIDAKPAHVGEPADVELEAFVMDCVEEKSFSRGVESRCTTTDVRLDDLGASCDDAACDVTVVGPRKLRVVGRRIGPATLRVHAQNDDGRPYEGTGKLSFLGR